MTTPEPRAPEIAELLGAMPVAWSTVCGGYSQARRWAVTLPDGTSAFIKVGTDPFSCSSLRAEAHAYETLRGAFLPRYLGWRDGDEPLLAIEDLSAAFWPPPWTDARVRAVMDALADVHATPAPDGFPALTDLGDFLRGWNDVAAEPEKFLALEQCSPSWLDRNLDTLIEAQASVRLEGDALLHLDVRSDNLCFRDERALLVDWSWARVGNPDVDLGFWLPSLAYESDHLPESLLPDAPGVAALVSGFFAARGSQPADGADRVVRELQRTQLKTALPWVVRALDLGPVRS